MENTEIQKHVDQVLEEMKGIVIEDQQQYEAAADFLKKTKKTAKIVKDHYEPERVRTYDVYKSVTDSIKGFTDKLSEAERTVKKAMSVFYQAEEKKRLKIDAENRRKEEEKRLESAIETGNDTILEKPVAIVKEEVKKVEGISTVDVWEFEIVDKSKINSDYLMIDMKAIGSIVRSMKDRAQGVLGEGVKVTVRKDIRARI